MKSPVIEFMPAVSPDATLIFAIAPPINNLFEDPVVDVILLPTKSATTSPIVPWLRIAPPPIML